jgi:putative transposase
MSNHVHLILIPPHADALRAVLSSVHTTYSQRINRMHDLSGHLFQGRYASYAMDDAHMMVAVRYVENNPVVAGLVDNVEDWRWSSARAHVSGVADGLTDLGALKPHVRNWRAMLADGLDAADRVEASLRSGLPLAEPVWLAQLAERLGTAVTPGRRGPKRKAAI